LERVIETLDFQRVSEIHIVADTDWADLWLAPRLPEFRARYPNILFCINGDGDVPLRIGSPDLQVIYGNAPGKALFRDVIVTATGPDNSRRLADWDAQNEMEGMPLLHLKRQRDDEDYPGWVEWSRSSGIVKLETTGVSTTQTQDLLWRQSVKMLAFLSVAFRSCCVIWRTKPSCTRFRFHRTLLRHFPIA